jgi:heme exporter protein A
MLAVQNLSQTVQDNKLLYDKLNFELNSGQLLYIVGENGTGKTTLLKQISGLSNPEKGQISWYKSQIGSIRSDYVAKITYLPDRVNLKDNLTVQENLEFVVSINNCSKNQSLSISESLQLFKMLDYNKFT